MASCSDPQTFCTRLRQAISASPDVNFLRALWTRNAALVQSLREHRPDLMTKKGLHYTLVLEHVFEQQLNRLTSQNGGDPPPPAMTVDKSALALAAPRRIRDEGHLAFVASLPCLVCGRAPSHAHHLRFAQLRALGRKVSDEWVVPLCNLHHRALHDEGNEEAWWGRHGIDALTQAERLWQARHPVIVARQVDPTESTPTTSTPAAQQQSVELPLGTPAE
jgi:hypothetical protein